MMLAMQGSLESFVKLFFYDYKHMLEYCFAFIVCGRCIQICANALTVWFWIGIRRFGRWGHSIYIGLLRFDVWCEHVESF